MREQDGDVGFRNKDLVQGTRFFKKGLNVAAGWTLLARYAPQHIHWEASAGQSSFEKG